MKKIIWPFPFLISGICFRLLRFQCWKILIFSKVKKLLLLKNKKRQAKSGLVEHLPFRGSVCFNWLFLVFRNRFNYQHLMSSTGLFPWFNLLLFISWYLFESLFLVKGVSTPRMKFGRFFGWPVDWRARAPPEVPSKKLGLTGKW